MSEPIVVGNRLELSRTTAILAVGDVLAILAFVVAGMLQHGGDPANVVELLDTTLPFLIGWLPAAFFIGCYAPAVLRNSRETAARALVAWVVADLFGQGLRATPFFGGNFAVPFLIVSLILGGLLLVFWRAGIAQRTVL
jgi:hypothetical protein